ncbi:glycogen debranching protein [Belliella kenyensis]|uniref:Glycogen debranching protein n=1 Tax=Belliella kenyensis TaxID=1472724 RepID=A0ABV8EHW3_9BACT|nr:glycogen debranching protein [Belliella kenyensis]MCH7401422.1 glycogen debranching protein [Belliella kenyensis]MDN3602865.1 glycogen debranching protein [Belliella kenyensis]
MKRNKNLSLLILVSILLVAGCQDHEATESLQSLVKNKPSLKGKTEYLASPYVTAGDRLYMVGHQDGSFPDLGWHVHGEMGGIWNHPIKLMDGFTASLITDGTSLCLETAKSFTNYPFANKHEYTIPQLNLEIERFQFVPEGKEGIVVEYLLKNEGNSKLDLTFNFTGHVDLRPVWLGEESGMVDHIDDLTFDEGKNFWLGKDNGNDWYVIFGSDEAGKPQADSDKNCEYQPIGKGKAASLSYQMNIPSGHHKIIRFYISGSYQSQKAAEATFDELKSSHASLLEEKIAHYEHIASLSKISIPDKEIEEAFEWVKYNTEWLVRDVPEQGKGLGAGMPDYPWWFGVDNEYTLKGAIATGRKDLVYSTIDLIHSLSEKNENGRVIHEVSTNGVIFNPGNINETPQFGSLIWWVYQWTGDRDFLEKYYPFVKKGLKWLMETNDKDGNLFPDGYGMMEIHGLESEMIDVAVYTQKAFDDAAQMARVMGESEQSKSYQETADKLKQKINEEFWVEEFNSYADFIGTTAEALHLIDAAIIRADTLNKPWAVEELQLTKRKLSTYPKDKKQGFVLFHNWVVNTPMEMKIADREKAIKALDKGKKFVNPFGVFVTGIDRDERSESADGKFEGSKVFSYTGAVMTLPTGVQAIAENNYGRPDEALDYLKRMTRSFGFALPGSIYEVSPDYGMMAQAWNLYSYAVPIVSQFFGISPDAANKIIYIKPQMPKTWTHSSIENVVIGENSISITYKKEDGKILIEISQQKADWEIHFDPSFFNASSLKLNKSHYEPVEKGSYSSKGKTINIEMNTKDSVE